MESYLIRQERCPECAKQGKDRHGDNLSVYSDGHSFCYSCGYVDGSRKKFPSNREEPTRPIKQAYLPFDSEATIPERALAWCRQYSLSKVDLMNNDVLWSEKEQRLIFPIYGPEGLLAWQGRWFGQGEKVKWYSIGDLKSIFHILGKNKTKLVLTEDIISAIRVSKHYQAMPLFGSHIGIIRFKRIRMLVEKTCEVCIWLDPDKRKESLVEARRGSLVGLNIRTIYSDKDPKEYLDEEIKEIVK
jgi:hypothetical protein